MEVLLGMVTTTNLAKVEEMNDKKSLARVSPSWSNRRRGAATSPPSISRTRESLLRTTEVRSVRTAMLRINNIGTLNGLFT